MPIVDINKITRIQPDSEPVVIDSVRQLFLSEKVALCEVNGVCVIAIIMG